MSYALAHPRPGDAGEVEHRYLDLALWQRKRYRAAPRGGRSGLGGFDQNLGPEGVYV
jgi:hypothetical protein